MTTSMLLGWWMRGCSSMEWVVEQFIYTLAAWHKHTQPHLPSQSCYHKSNITFPNITFIYIATLATFSKKVDRCPYLLVLSLTFSSLHISYFSFYPFHSVDVDTISFAWSGIFPNVASPYQTYMQLHITQLLGHLVSLLCTLFSWLHWQGKWHSWSVTTSHYCL